VPTITALRAARPGRVAVELDGAAWRTLPVEAVLRAGLAAGRRLDRPRARLLRRELRRLEALSAAGKALRGRDLAAAELEARLERAGVAPAPRAETLAVLDRAGLVDDRRFAVDRAAALARRGYGDAWIRWDLGRRGVAADLVEEAVTSLESERVRLERVLGERGGGPRVARALARRGFGEEAVEAAACAPVAADGGAALT
jgi:SOS response regulatory protein OraA/RecX